MPDARPDRRRDRTTVRRLPRKQVHDRAVLDAILDTALSAHVGLTDGGLPLVVPMGIARDRDELLVHGSAASRTLRALAAGTPACVTVTLLDGVAVARSRFESSMLFRCAMVFGTFQVLHGRAKRHALDVLAERLLPGLGGPGGQRPPSPGELAATAVLALPLADGPEAVPGGTGGTGLDGGRVNWSVKVSHGPSDEPPDDRQLPLWAGVVPLRHGWGEPVPAPDLAPGTDVPAAIAAWPERA